MSGEMPTTCFPVTGETNYGKRKISVQDFNRPTDLTVIDREEKIIACPLFQGGKCEGKNLCIMQEVMELTVVQK